MPILAACGEPVTDRGDPAPGRGARSSDREHRPSVADGQAVNAFQ
jgi:hypothetical protein